jgi:putative FmdB family regulatory protein
MPIYEYNCKTCGVFEVTQRITESPLDTCPTCGAHVSRLISHTSFVLKGSGWYATDYARSNGAKSDTPAASESSGSSEASKSTSESTSSSSSNSSSGSSSESSKSSGEKAAASKSD